MDSLPARDGEAYNRALRRGRGPGSERQMTGNLREAVIHNLPTPTVSDQYTDNLKSSQQSDGSLHSVTLAQIVNRPDLLPTPQTGDGEKGMTSTPEHRKATGHQVMLSNHAPQLAESWGKFAPAIHRWETITGNPVPTPTIPDGRDGQHRLNPAFAEWMMGLEPGWITDVDIPRNAQLKACGNGVVPQQAALALRILEAYKYVVQDN